MARATCGNDSITIQHLFQRLVILLVKGNINLILNRIPRDIQPEIIGILHTLLKGPNQTQNAFRSETHTSKRTENANKYVAN